MLVFLIYWTALLICVHPLPRLLDCKATFNQTEFTLAQNITMENFFFLEQCNIKITIPNWSYLTVSGNINFINVGSRLVTKFNTFIFDGQYDPLEEHVISPPYLGVHFGTGSNVSYHVNFVLKKYDFDFFKTVEELHLKTVGELVYIPLNELKPSITYIYKSNHLLNIRAAYGTQQNNGLKIPNFENILMYNGTDKNAKPIGLAYRLMNLIGVPHDRGLNVKGLTLFVIRPFSDDPDPEFCRLFVTDKAKIDAISPVFYIFWYWKHGDFKEDQSTVTMYSTRGESETCRIVIISKEEKLGVYEELVITGVDMRYDDEGPPNLDIYSGWPNANQSSLLASYSEDVYATDMPQKFGGRVRTLVVPCGYVNVAYLRLANPRAKTFEDQPFPNRKGFLRNNWKDGSFVANRTETLTLRENENRTLFNFTFTFEPNCLPGSYLIVDTKKESLAESYRLNCSDVAMTVTSSSIQAELRGDAVVHYVVSFSRLPSIFPIVCLCCALCIVWLS